MYIFCEATRNKTLILPTKLGGELVINGRAQTAHDSKSCATNLRLLELMSTLALAVFLHHLRFLTGGQCFKLWRDNVRYKLFCQQRRKLSHRLFLAKDSFAGPYIELRRHMIDMQVRPVP